MPGGWQPARRSECGAVYATWIYVRLRLCLRPRPRPHKGHTCRDSGPLLRRAGAQEGRKRGL